MSVLGFLVIRSGFHFLILTEQTLFAQLFYLCLVNYMLLSEGQGPLAATSALLLIMIIAFTWLPRA